MKYEIINCSRKCSSNPLNLPAGVGELVHRWFEEGANRETIMERAKQFNVKFSGGALQRHKSNHLVPARDPNSPLPDDDNPNRRFSELEVIDSVIQRFARQMQHGQTNVTAEQGLRAIELKHKMTEGSVFEAMFDAMMGVEDEDLSDLEPGGEADVEEPEGEDDPPLEPPIPGG